VSGGGIFRARLRPDGFVSIRGGSITTHPLVFPGRSLFVNGVGPLEVEGLKGTGELLGSAQVEGDSLRHEIKFNGRSLRDLAPDGTVRFRFTVAEGGNLYSFTITAD
jgi:hypothetical protein